MVILRRKKKIIEPSCFFFLIPWTQGWWYTIGSLSQFKVQLCLFEILCIMPQSKISLPQLQWVLLSCVHEWNLNLFLVCLQAVNKCFSISLGSIWQLGLKALSNSLSALLADLTPFSPCWSLGESDFLTDVLRLCFHFVLPKFQRSSSFILWFSLYWFPYQSCALNPDKHIC